MSKSVSGITKRNKRSIQEIKQARSEENNGDRGGGGNQKPPRQEPPSQRGSERATTFGLWFVGIVGLLFVFFLFSVVFAETTVTVYPQTADIKIDQIFTASNAEEPEGIPYSVVTAEDTLQLSATSTGSEYREAAAAGQVTIYNTYSNDEIRLVPNTRFQTEDGLIYRTREAVTVPGQSSQGNPGTAVATILADAIGGEYNTGQARLEIPGFDGTVYEGEVYGETAGISGGVAGDVPVIASSTQQALEEQAAKQLQERLASEVRADLPEGFVFYEDGQFFSAEITDSAETSSTTTTLTVTGRLEAVTFDGAQLSSRLATAYSADVPSDANVRIQDLEDFDFRFANRSEFNPGVDQSFEFSLSGDSVIVWQYDERALVRDLRGLQKDRLEEVLVNYDGIQEAGVVTRPFWKRTLPAEAAEIQVNTVIR